MSAFGIFRTSHSRRIIGAIIFGLLFFQLSVIGPIANQLNIAQGDNLLATGSLATGSLADKIPRKIFSGWLPYYAMKAGLASVGSNSDLIQDISPFWYTLKSATKIADLYTSANPSVPIATPLQTLKDLNFKIIPTITDGTSSGGTQGVLAGLIAKSDSRALIIKSIVNLVMLNNFDGIDLDFENFAFVDGTSSWATTQPNWIKFIKQLSTALHSNGKLLSVTTPVLFDPKTNKTGYWVYSWAAIASDIDRLRIMTYDYSTRSPGPIGPISWTESSVQYAVSVVPASKVFVGIAGYGRDWVTKVDGICPVDLAGVINVTARAATFVMRDAVALAASYGAVPTFNPKFAENTFTYQKLYSGFNKTGLPTQCTATRTAWFQGAQGYMARANLVGKYRLGGLAAWTIGMEDPTASDSLRMVAKSIAADVVVGTITSDQTLVSIGEPITVTGMFTLPDSTPIVGLAAHLEIKNSLGDWHSVFSGITSEKGTLTTPIILGELTSMRMISDESWERLSGMTSTKDIAISRLISWSPPASIKAGVTYSISGQIEPKSSGVNVVLQSAGSTNAASNTMVTTGSAGQFMITIKEKTPGFRRIRLMTVADSKYAAGMSEYFNLLVR